MRGLAGESHSAFLAGYVTLLTDLTNLRAVVRSLRMGYGTGFLRKVLFNGGNIDTKRLISVASTGAILDEVYFGSPLEETAAAGTHAMRGETTLTAFERLGDEALIKYLKPAKYISFGEQPLIAFIVAKEAEIVSLRTILSGRKAEVSREVIRKRLREVYV
jgi:V/A-type H+-transporting ATPase subunit C